MALKVTVPTATTKPAEKKETASPVSTSLALPYDSMPILKLGRTIKATGSDLATNIRQHYTPLAATGGGVLSWCMALDAEHIEMIEEHVDTTGKTVKPYLLLASTHGNNTVFTGEILVRQDGKVYRQAVSVVAQTLAKVNLIGDAVLVTEPAAKTPRK